MCSTQSGETQNPISVPAVLRSAVLIPVLLPEGPVSLPVSPNVQEPEAPKAFSSSFTELKFTAHFSTVPYAHGFYQVAHIYLPPPPPLPPSCE